MSLQVEVHPVSADVKLAPILSEEDIARIAKQLQALSSAPKEHKEEKQDVKHANPKPKNGKPKGVDLSAASPAAFINPVEAVVNDLKQAYKNPAAVNWVDFADVIVSSMQQVEKLVSLTGAQKSNFVKQVLSGFADYLAGSLPQPIGESMKLMLSVLRDSEMQGALINLICALDKGAIKLAKAVKAKCLACC